MQAIFLEDDQKVKAFITGISKPHLTKYLQEADGDERKALLLYHWNSQLSQALYLPLQSWEIVLRNKVSGFLSFKYGTTKWHSDPRALRNFNRNDRRRLDDTVDRLNRDLAPSVPTNDQVVADLSAGFWVSQFGSDYAAQYGWKNNIKFRVFTNDHSITRERADAMCNDLLELRNRVAHHEPIFHLPLDVWRRNLDTLLSGMCGVTASYMSSACSFSAIWNARPGIQGLLGEPPNAPNLVNISQSDACDNVAGLDFGAAERAATGRIAGKLGLNRTGQ